MIRFQYHSAPDEHLAFEHFSLEGDVSRGYVLLGWSTSGGSEGFDGAPPEMLQMWFETLGEAMSHCANEFGITRDRWQAPTTATPPAGSFSRSTRGRRAGESNVLNPDNIRAREQESTRRKPPGTASQP